MTRPATLLFAITAFGAASVFGASTCASLTGLTLKNSANIEASRVRNGQTDRTRPLCPYPQVAVYKRSGSMDDSANFSCKVQ
jgi:Tannase and feruloyl esterase.